MTSKVLIALYLGLMAASANAATPGKKGYTVTDLKTVVSNGNHCDSLLGDLNEMFKQPIAIHFESKGGALHTVELDEVDDDDLIQDALDLDSMDFLNLVTAVHEATGIDVPERDYPALASVGGFVGYLAAAAP